MIDYDSFVGPLCHRSSVCACAGSSFVNIRGVRRGNTALHLQQAVGSVHQWQR